jgi:hypothetical protein
MELPDWRETVRRLVATDPAFRAALVAEIKANPDIADDLLKLLTDEPKQFDGQEEKPSACGPQPGQP